MPKEKVKKLKVSELTEIHPQAVMPGNIIRSTVSGEGLVVTDVVVTVHLSNGTMEMFTTRDRIHLVPPTAIELPKELTDNSNPKPKP